MSFPLADTAKVCAEEMSVLGAEEKVDDDVGAGIHSHQKIPDLDAHSEVGLEALPEPVGAVGEDDLEDVVDEGQGVAADEDADNAHEHGGHLMLLLLGLSFRIRMVLSASE